MPFILAFLGGLLPVLIWLWFFEHDKKTPEPGRLILLAFFGGMISVIAAILFEKIAIEVSPDMTITIVLWAAIEELVKFVFCYVLVLHQTKEHEPIDAIMYLIATALGFAALENSLFLLTPIMSGDFQDAFITGNFRFIGATLLHVVASSAIGLAIAFSFYKDKLHQRFYMTVGIFIAIALHTFFNLSIILSDGSNTMLAFYAVWIGVIIILLLIEKVKRITNTNN